MMDEYDEHDLFSEILITLNLSPKTLIILEADSDCNVLDSFIDANHCETLPAHSKTTALGALELAISQDLPGVIALVDRDWYGYGEELPESDRLFLTDHYDLDATVILAGDHAHRLAVSHCTSRQVREVTASHGVDSFKDVLVRLCFPLGAVRMHSHQNRLGLNLRGLPMAHLLSGGIECIDLNGLIIVCQSRYKGGVFPQGLDVNDVVEKAKQDFDDWAMYCSGHDMAAVMGHIIRTHWKNSVSNENIENALRAAFAWADLIRCGFYGELDPEVRNSVPEACLMSIIAWGSCR